MKKKILPLSIVGMFLLIGTAKTQVIHKKLSSPISIVAKDKSNSNKSNSPHVDIDADGKDDFYISYFNYPAFNVLNLNFNEVDTNDSRIEFIYDKDVPKSPIGSLYLKKMTADAEINGSEKDWTRDYPLLGDNYSAHLIGAGEVIIGYRLIKGSNNYKYGWLKLEITGSAEYVISVTEYAFQNTENTAIKAGSLHDITEVAQVEEKESHIRFYPNPCHDKLRFSTTNDIKPHNVNIIDVTGQIHLNALIHHKDEIDVSLLPSGLYFIQLEMDNGESQTQRLIID